MSTNSSRVSDQGNKLNHIIDLQNSNVQSNVKEKVKQKLAQDAQFLLQKKRKEQQKRLRVKKMQEDFQRNRQKKVKVLSEKQVKSEQVREKNREQQNKKFKHKADEFKKKVDKIEHDNQQQLQKALNLQKQRQNRKHSKSFSKTSKDSNFNPMQTGRSSSKIPAESVDEKIEHIMSRVNKAQRIHEQINTMMVNRIREKTKSITQAQKRALSHSLLEEHEILRNYYQKTEQIHRLASNSKGENEKRLLQKRRSVKQKLDKCSQNLKNLSYQQQQKLQQLQAKFNRKSEPKQWKDPRLQKYKQRWQQNSRRIEQQKQEKANQILQKHEQITQQHRMYKQQKDKLIQAVKHIN